MTKCITCSSEFVAKRNTAKFCSSKCRVFYSRRNSVSSVTLTPVTLKEDVKDVTLIDKDTLYFRIDSYTHDTWKDSPEFKELKRRLSCTPLKTLKDKGYYIPTALYGRDKKGSIRTSERT